MKIRLMSPFASLSEFSEVDIPELTIVTGKNGNGKSHLLQAIRDGYVSFLDEAQIVPEWKPIRNAVLFTDIGLTTQESNPEPTVVFEDDKDWVNRDADINTHVLNLVNFIVTNDLVNEARNVSRSHLLSTEPAYIANLSSLVEAYYDMAVKPDRMFESLLIDQFLTDHAIGYIQGTLPTQKDLGLYERNKSLSQRRRSSGDVNVEISTLHGTFSTYLNKRLDNYLAYFNKKELGIINGSISDQEFDSTYPTPWTVLNQILERYDIDLRFQQFDISEFSINRHQTIQVHAWLKRPHLNVSVRPDQLSSGENVFLGLISKIFLNKYYQQTLNLPDVILLDEPDAHLHPEFAQKLIGILNDVFIQELGIRVILTTHSPTTVAMSPEKNVFKITNGHISSLTSISKDDALTLLTNFLPTLSIDYNNHRQVFVEGPNDRNYFQGLFNTHNLHSEKPLKRKLYFIAGDNGSSNSTQVINVVKAIRESGNKTAYGIIDWDKGDISSIPENVMIHGANERYSLENFLFDPIYCILIMLSENNSNIHKELGLPPTYAEQLIGKESNETLQKFVDYFFRRIREKNPGQYTDLGEKKQVHYHNQKSVWVPRKYLEAKGHTELINVLHNTFPLFRDDTKFKDRVITTILKCYPFVPQASISLIENLSNL